ncbi:LegC family aminotransferase [Barnesiella sp. CU968]|jgi:perosamine synthetase|uniref:LegC family aminotransferase n=1 Tax=Barnesiella sp. CU968 TaxID=2780099 RepID=UPI0014353D44|nr:LegC family aminotransferase [Barnesiella sp. CU968]GFI38997.1 putative pyridoxal phosphate-dependent aminotransferase EpsN [Muribaculaceae bacterium]
MEYELILRMIRDRFGAGEGDFVPLHAPTFSGNEKKYLDECIDSTFVSSVGAFVDRFERDIAEYTGARRAVVCVSGTNALHMALMLASVERDDEVLTQSLSFIATCNAISYIGAHPVFIDVDYDTMGLSPAALREWLEKHTVKDAGNVLRNKSTGRRVKSVVPMHTFGHPCRIDEIASICDEYCLELVEDAAESIGSFYKGKHTGTFGRIGAISFNGNKTITTGGGGMLLFNDEKLADLAKHLTTQAKVPSRWEFIHDHIGYNYRMPNINAALGCAQLEEISGFLASKRKTAEIYREFFASEPGGIKFMAEPTESVSNYWLNAIAFPTREERDRFLQYSNDHGVMTRPIWELMWHLPMFEHCERDSQTNTVLLADTIVNLPSSVKLES